MEEDCIYLGNEKINYSIYRKKIKNINMRINSDCNIIVSAPKKVKIEEIRKLIQDKINWIKKTQIKLKNSNIKKEKLNFENGEKIYFLGKQYILKIITSPKNDVKIQDDTLYIYIKKNDKKYIEAFYIKVLKQNLKYKTALLVKNYCEILSAHNIPIPNIEVRKMKSRWGTCIPGKNKVIFNISLIKTPESCMEYVVLHELTHFKYINHNKKFYDFITVFMPDWKLRKKILDEEYVGIIL